MALRGLPLSAYLSQLKAAPKADRPDVVRALGSFGKDALPAIYALLAEKERRVTALALIKQMGDTTAEEPLLSALNDPGSLGLKTLSDDATTQVAATLSIEYHIRHRS